MALTPCPECGWKVSTKAKACPQCGHPQDEPKDTRSGRRAGGAAKRRAPGTEAGFLQAIQENPNDPAPRLVYADWLEERGDVRGEFLRLEHQLTQIPQRLAQLRAQIDPEWLAAVYSRCKVVLVSCLPAGKIMAIKLVREITGLGLKESKDVVESLPKVLREGVTRDEAERLAQQFRDVGVVAIE
jgi:uncharacterized protein (TIGR02996 family)